MKPNLPLNTKSVNDTSEYPSELLIIMYLLMLYVNGICGSVKY